MDIKDLFDIIPKLLDLFIPGFIFLVTCKYFGQSKDEDFNVTAIRSVVLSYIFQLVSSVICGWFGKSGIIVTIIAIILSFVIAIIVVKTRITKAYKKVTKCIGKITGSCDIWHDLFDLNKGSYIRFFTKYNGQEVSVVGNVKFFEAYGDGECNIVIENYTITYKDNSIYKNDVEGATMMFNTKNIYGLEVHYGQ